LKTIFTVLLAFALSVSPAEIFAHADGHGVLPDVSKAPVDHDRTISKDDLGEIDGEMMTLTEYLYDLQPESAQKVWESLIVDFDFSRARAAKLVNVLNLGLESIDLKKSLIKTTGKEKKKITGDLSKAVSQRGKLLGQSLSSMNKKDEGKLLSWIRDSSRELEKKAAKEKKAKTKKHSHGDEKAHSHD
jgi:hypothetical protein